MCRIAVAVGVAALATAPVACSLLTDTDALIGSADDASTVSDAPDEAETSAADAADARSDVTVTADADAATSRYAAAVLADAPLLYYRFGETNGKDARDEVTGTSVAYPVAGFTFGTKGALAGDPDTSITTDGSTGLDLPEGADFEGVRPFSVEVWVDVFPLAAGQNDIGFVVDHQTYSGARRGWDLRVSRSEVSTERFSGAGTNGAVSFLHAPVKGVWHHVVATFDGTTQRLYFDGVRRTMGASSIAVPKIGGSFKIATQNCTACSGNPFIGSLDELAIYPKALSEERIAAHLAAAR